MIIKSQFSPNFSRNSRKTKDIKLIVIHYTGMQSKIVSVKRLMSKNSKVSCHYLIDRKGEIVQMVQDKKVAWHAGKSKWKNFKNLNKNSIGIELVNKGHQFGYENFTNVQIKKLIILCHYLKKKFRIHNSNIVGHSDISPIRKKDPGEKFPWEFLQKNKIGIWYKIFKSINTEIGDKKIKILFFKNIYKLGYRYFSLKKRSKTDIYLIKAFQRRFNPNNVTGVLDKKTYIISHFLAI
tara:strand:+ start:1983 stop:2693 length:711 start_codon:yes stop_codon:yes gene_type:complete